MDIETLALARAYTKQSLNGVGAIKGNPCTIKKIEEDDDNNRVIVTFAWTDNTGVERTSQMRVKNGLTIKEIRLSPHDELVIEDFSGNIYKSQQLDFKYYSKIDDDGIILEEHLPYYLKNGHTMTGTWNASTNTPQLRAGIGNDREYYIVSTSGVQNIEGVEKAYPVGAYIAFENGQWRSIVTPPPEGGGTFTGTATVACGGIKKGNSFAYATVQEMFEALISPKLDPKVVIETVPTNTLYKKGTTVSGLKVKATPTIGTDPLSTLTIYAGNTILYTGTNPTNGVAVSVDYEDFTTNTTFKAEVFDAGGLSATASKTIEFINPFYMGILDSSTVNETIVSSLTMVLQKSMPYTWSGITMTNKRACIAYPSNLGMLKSVKDGNGFEVLDSFEKTNINIGGVVYFCYCMKDTGTLNNGKMVLTV